MPTKNDNLLINLYEIYLVPLLFLPLCYSILCLLIPRPSLCIGLFSKILSYVLRRYYYAVVECDSSATADYLYKTCDGVEFERTSNKLDLRFIPDSMEFKHQPRDIATEVICGYDFSS